MLYRSEASLPLYFLHAVGWPIGAEQASGGWPIGADKASGGWPIGAEQASGGWPIGAEQASGVVLSELAAVDVERGSVFLTNCLLLHHARTEAGSTGGMQ